MHGIDRALWSLLLFGAVISNPADPAAEYIKRPPLVIGPAPGVGTPQPQTSGEEETGGDMNSFDERHLDLAFWSSVRDSSNPADFNAYLDAFPNGTFARLARNKLAKEPAETMPDEPSPDPGEMARLLQVELRRVGCNPGVPDGRWGPRSRRALEEFNRQEGTAFRADIVTAEALEAVRSRDNACRTVVRKPKRQAAPAGTAPTARTAQPNPQPQRRTCIRSAWWTENMPGGHRLKHAAC